MSDLEKRFHETWLGMVQPVEGLVVSVPVLIDAQSMQRQPPETQAKLHQLCPAAKRPHKDGDEDEPEHRTIADLGAFLHELLQLEPSFFDAPGALPEELSLYVHEGKQQLTPTLALRKQNEEANGVESKGAEPAADSTPASRVGTRYVALVWDVGAFGADIDLDKPETATGPWEYPPAAKFDRLLRHCRVPIGILTNRAEVRLVYAPHGESSGHITFRMDDMATVGGRPILDAFVMLLSAARFFGVAEEQALPALLAESRKRQANVTTELAAQVFDALTILLRGFEAAAERDGRDILDDALAQENDHLYKGLLTVLLRLVFVLYAEDRGLLPTDKPLYAEHMSVLALYERLQADAGAHPDSMSRRFGAWGQLVALFRAVFLGAEHGDFRMPARKGTLFDPNTYPFLEGWGPAGGAPIKLDEHRAAVRVPTLDDETVFRVLDKLIVFEGQRLSYRTLDVEQIGSVYEALMGYHVVRLDAPAVCMRPDGIWLTVEEALAAAPAQRAKWLKENIGLSNAQADKLAKALKDAKDSAAALEELGELAKGGTRADRSLARARAGQLVLQPGAERRRTSSHYTPRSLSAPIVRRTLEPLLACMGSEPASDRILDLKICDPAMGSGAFLVEACRFLGDQVVAAWTREGTLTKHARPNEDPVLHARRLVAQRCLYGVDKNDAAVELAKLSLWLVTLAKDLPFTFLDHALRHGDSLVGLDFDQIRAFHWKPQAQLTLASKVLDEALSEAITIRQRILELAEDGSDEAQREKHRLLSDAHDASERARLIGDLVVGAFFAEENDRARERERVRRLDLVERWIAGDGGVEGELREMQRAIRGRLPVFHWMLEFPEVFHAERPDPLDEGRANRVAMMDAFVGNPPFMGMTSVAPVLGVSYRDWLFATHEGTVGQSDISAQFFRLAARHLGANGTVGLISTNTISQGDTRTTGLQWLLGHGCSIYDAVRSLPWPGEASVSVAVIHLAAGSAARADNAVRLNGARVPAINSRLRAGSEQPDPGKLPLNASLSFQGHMVSGLGFVLAEAEYNGLVAANPANRECLFPYLGGEEVNTHPTQEHSRFIICFGRRSLEEASRWPELLSIVRTRVKPERDRVRRDAHRERWWQFGDYRSGLQEAIKGASRCLVTGIVSKHLMFSFQPPNRMFSHKLYVFPFDRYTPLAVLQSRPHEAWTRLLSSTLEDRLNYSASDCFETFPFPLPDPRAAIPALEDIGERLYTARAAYMVDTEQGLTQTYNRLKDPACDEPRILELRHLHEEMDRAVLDAYGWTDIAVPPFCPMTPEEQKALEAFQDEVIDRLFVLNAERAVLEMSTGFTPQS